METDKFKHQISSGYNFTGESILIGAAQLGEQAFPDLPIRIPLSTLNRHGLVTGATGTGKTKSLQKLVESLSNSGVPVLIMDIKGDISGISQEGTTNEKIIARQSKLGLEWNPQKFPVEFLTISEENGIRLRSTVSEFGPILISKILELNDTQRGLISVIFKFCDDNKFPLVDLQDLKAIFNFILNEGEKEFEKEYGMVSSPSVSTILRKIVELEQQGADKFFGEPSFDVNDLVRQESGRGIVNILRLADMQNSPKLFSTFMLCLLAEIYSVFPEEGDIEKPKLILVIDEAHLVFDESSRALLDQLITVVKLIRSKGVGLIFCTQSPNDVPASILAQLGLKIQHALRAFTATDRKAIKLASENFPISEFYTTNREITELGIGEALVTALNEKGLPTPLVRVTMSAP